MIFSPFIKKFKVFSWLLIFCAMSMLKAQEIQKPSRDTYEEHYICIGVEGEQSAYELDLHLRREQDVTALWEGALDYFFEGKGLEIQPGQYVIFFESRDPREPIAGLQYYQQVQEGYLIGHWNAWSVDQSIDIRKSGTESCMKIPSKVFNDY